MKKRKGKKRNLTVFLILGLIIFVGLLFTYLQKSKEKLICSSEKTCTQPRGVCMPGGVCLN